MFGSLLSPKKEDLTQYEAKLMESFARIAIPELERDIVALNCVRAIRFEPSKAIIDLVLPTFALKSEKEIALSVKHQAIEILPSATVVELNVFADVQPAAPQSLLKPGISDVRNVILVASGKGGVGKSTVASNLAVALKNLGCRVGLLDADVYGPSIPTMFGVAADQEIQGIKIDGAPEALMIPLERHGVKLMSVGFLVEPDSALVWRGPMIASASMQMFFNVVWGDLDYLIVDLPPGTGDVQLTISQKVSVAGAIIVSTPQDVALVDVVRAKAMFDKVNIPVLGVVENMSYFVCDGCSKRHDIFAHGGVRSAAVRLGLEFMGEIPLRSSIREASDQGAPATLLATSEVADEFRELAFRTAAVVAKASLNPEKRPLPSPPVTKKPAPVHTEKKKGLPVIN
jgi:ATP-binding protein involved in chromosome partitioning